MPRRLLSLLVFGLPVLVVAFGVVMGGQALAAALQDASAARLLLGVAVGCLLLICIDIVLLVGWLGMQAWHAQQTSDEQRPLPPSE